MGGLDLVVVAEIGLPPHPLELCFEGAFARFVVLLLGDDLEELLAGLSLIQQESLIIIHILRLQLVLISLILLTIGLPAMHSPPPSFKPLPLHLLICLRRYGH